MSVYLRKLLVFVSAAISAVAALCLASALSAQESPPARSVNVEHGVLVLGDDYDGEMPTVDSQITQRLGEGAFRTLSGRGAAAVRYTTALDRAHHVLQRLDLLAFYFNRWSDAPVSLAVYIMDRDEWGLAGLETPYGLPIRSGPTSIIAPAAGDDKTVLLWQEVLGQQGLPNIDGQPIYGTRRQAASLLASDTLMQVEASRAFVERGGLVGGQGWIADLMSHVVSSWIVSKHETGRIQEIHSLFGLLEQRYGSPGTGASLLEYSPLLLYQGRPGIERWLWYQGMFHRGAEILLEKSGDKTVPRLIKLSKKNGGRLSAETLLKQYPELSGWLAEFPVPGQSGG
jgi:hypothetical protein